MNTYIKRYILKMDSILQPELAGKEAAKFIEDKLLADEPVMIARLGAVEIKAVMYGVLPPPLNIC